MIDDQPPDAPSTRLQLGTLSERIRCTCAEGHEFITETLVSIDIEDDPEAIEVLTDKGLQNVICPTCRQLWQIAVPVTFQDRERRRYCLFVPEVLAHRELDLRADLMRRIADCPPDELPYYAIDFTTLVGVRALQQWLFGAPSQAPRAAEAAPATAPAPGANRPATPAPPPEPPGDGPAIHAAFADLQGPEARYSTIPPEPDVAAVKDGDPMFDDWLDDDAIERVEPQRRNYRTPSGSQRAITGSHPTITSVPPSISSVPPSISSVPPSISSVPPSASSTPPPERQDPVGPVTPRDSRPSIDFAGILVGDDDDFDDFEIEDDEPDLELDGDDDPFDGLNIERVPRRADAVAPPPSGPAVPTELEEGADRCLEVIGDRVILHARTDEGAVERFDSPTSDLWFQLQLADDFPLLMLTLVADPQEDLDAPLRWCLDLTRGTHREVSRCLRRQFHAEIRLYDEDLEPRKTFERRADRELNVSLLLERAGEALGKLADGHDGWEAAIEALGPDALPSPVDLPALFAPTGPGKASTFGDVARNLATLTEWLEPERFEQLVYLRSFQLDYLEEITAETLTNAATWGVHIQDALKIRAVSSGIAANPSQLVGLLVERFDRLMRQGDGPDEEAAAANWQLLLADCRAHGLALDVELLDRADELLERQEVEIDDELAAGQRALAHPDRVDTERLLAMLDRRRLRVGAIEALVARGEKRITSRIISAFERLSFADLPRGFRALTAIGDGAAGQVAGLLQSDRPHIRQAAAILLERFALRRTLMPLFKALGTESSPIWTEHARAVAAAGAAAQRSVERAVSNREVPAERLALVVALLGDRDPGLAERFESLADEDDGVKVLELSRRALATFDNGSPIVTVGEVLRRVADGETIQVEDFVRLESEYVASVGALTEQ